MTKEDLDTLNTSDVSSDKHIEDCGCGCDNEECCDDIGSLALQDASLSFHAAKSIDELNVACKKINREYVDLVHQELIKAKDPKDKRELGQYLNALKDELNILFNAKKDELTASINNTPIDLSIPNQHTSYLSNNLLSQIKKDILSTFNKWGFEIQFSTELVKAEENFDQLLIGQQHPSVSKSETYYVDKSNLVLRTHCTCNSVHNLHRWLDKSSIRRLVTLGSVYRKDDSDARHTEQFNQVDILWVEEGLTVANLKWFIVELFKSIFGTNVKYRFRNSYFPFTNPSYELDMRCSCNEGDQCSICGGQGWIEVLGCGMLARGILDQANYGKNIQAIAAGIGIERLAMIKYQLQDIRTLYLNDFRLSSI